MKEWIKKYWWIVLAMILIAVAVWFLKPSTTILQTGPDAVVLHKFDSVKYVKKVDSLQSIITELYARLDATKENLKKLIEKQKIEITTIKTIPVDDLLALFNEYTGDSSYIQINGRDTSVISRMCMIESAVMLFVQGDQCTDREMYYLSSDSLNQSIVTKQSELIDAQVGRIKKLTDEFYQAEMVKDKLRNDLAKAAKKVRNRNIVIGVLAGATAAGIVVAATR